MALLVSLDEHGHLLRFEDWNAETARELAAQLPLQLTPAHFEILEASRTFYIQYHYAPGMRPLTKFLRAHLNRPGLDSIAMLQLFPNSPARLIALLAGLPKPANCL